MNWAQNFCFVAGCLAIGIVMLPNKATAEPITIDFTTVLTSPNGEAVQDCTDVDRSDPKALKCNKTVALTLGAFAANAVDQMETGLKPADIRLRGSLATKIRECMGPLSITKGKLALDPRDIDLIVEQIPKMSVPPSVGNQALNLLQAPPK